MLTVEIRVNNRTVYCRSARNISKGERTGIQVYETDAGVKIKHPYEDGIIKLAIEILKSIKPI